jgi:hypothetical protein
MVSETSVPSPLSASRAGAAISDLALIESPSTLVDPNDLLLFVHDYTTVDLNLETLLMPPYHPSDSPRSSLSTPTTQNSFEDSFSSASSVSFGYPASTSPTLDKTFFDSGFFPDPFVYTNSRPFLPTTQFIENVKPDFLALNSFESFNTDLFAPAPFFKEEAIHPSIEVPASPAAAQMEIPTFAPTRFENNLQSHIRPFAHTLPNFQSTMASSPSDDTVSEAPPSPPPKKPTRAAKQDKGIKCDHCGVDKTPLWRKVPNKENAYHWYLPITKANKQRLWSIL